MLWVFYHNKKERNNQWKWKETQTIPPVFQVRAGSLLSGCWKRPVSPLVTIHWSSPAPGPNLTAREARKYALFWGQEVRVTGDHLSSLCHSMDILCLKGLTSWWEFVTETASIYQLPCWAKCSLESHLYVWRLQVSTEVRAKLFSLQAQQSQKSGCVEVWETSLFCWSARFLPSVFSDSMIQFCEWDYRMRSQPLLLGDSAHVSLSWGEVSDTRLNCCLAKTSP